MSDPESADVTPSGDPSRTKPVVRLFLVPLVVAAGCVGAVWTFGYLALPGVDPARRVEALRQGGRSSWRSAQALAQELADPRNERLKRDAALARQLADVLTEQLDAGRTDDQSIMLRVFLCRALGEFYVEDGLPALVRAATVERDAGRGKELSELDVRRAALEAIAVLAGHLPPDRVRRDERLFGALCRAADRRSRLPADTRGRARLRATAVFALGVVGGDRAQDKLAEMLDDPAADARFNAATGLARHGDARAIAGLVPMLDPQNEDAVAGEERPAEARRKRAMVIVNALRATQRLARENARADLSSLRSAIEHLQRAEVDRGLRRATRPEAEKALALLRARRIRQK